MIVTDIMSYLYYELPILCVTYIMSYLYYKLPIL